MNILLGILLAILCIFELFLLINFIFEGKRIKKIIAIRMQLDNMKNPKTNESIPLVIKKEDLKFQDNTIPQDFGKIKVRSFVE